MKVVKGEGKASTEVEEKEVKVVDEEAETVKAFFKVKSVFKVEVEGDEEGEWIHGWLKKPNIQDFSMFTKLAESDRINALQTTFKSLWLRGDERIINDDDYLLAAMIQIDEVMSIKASRVAKH